MLQRFASDIINSAMRMAQQQALNSFSFRDTMHLLNQHWRYCYERMTQIDPGYYSVTVELTKELTKLPPIVFGTERVYRAMSPEGHSRLPYTKCGDRDMHSENTYQISGNDLWCWDAGHVHDRYPEMHVWLNYVPQPKTIFYTAYNRDPEIIEESDRVEIPENDPKRWRYGMYRMVLEDKVARNNHATLPFLSPIKIPSGSLVPRPVDPEKNGWFFFNWYKETTFTTKFNFGTEKPTADTTIYARLLDRASPDNLYIVQFFGTTIDPQIISQTAVNSETNIVTKPTDPTKTDFKFDGWYKDDQCLIAHNFLTDYITKDTVLYPKWVYDPKAIYYVSFDTNGGTAVSRQLVTSGTKAVEPQYPVRPDFVFSGWYSDAALTTAFAFTTAITADTTLYAKWTAVTTQTFTITYNANGGTGTAPVDSLSPYIATEAVEILGNTDLAKADSKFAGWNTKADGTGWHYSPGNILVIQGATTLYAEWVTTKEVTITFSGSYDTCFDQDALIYRGKNMVLQHMGNSSIRFDVTDAIYRGPDHVDDNNRELYDIVAIFFDYPYCFVTYQHRATGDYHSVILKNLLGAVERHKYNPFDFTGRDSQVKYLDAKYNDDTGMGVVVADYEDIYEYTYPAGGEKRWLPKIKRLGWTPDTLVIYPQDCIADYMIAHMAKRFANRNESTLMDIDHAIGLAEKELNMFLKKDHDPWARVSNAVGIRISDYL